MAREARLAIRLGALLSIFVFALLATEGSVDGLLADGPFTSDFFDAQAESLLDGRLDVPAEVASIEGFQHDGATYLYFGLFPAVLRLPIAAVSDGFAGRLSVLSMLVALTTGLLSAGRIMWHGRLRARGDVPLERWEALVLGGLTLALGLASPLLFLGARAFVYHEAELWGTATAILALEALLRWWDRPTKARLAVASLATAVALHARVSVGTGALAALALTLGLAWLWRHVPRSALPWLALAVVLPLASYAAVNMARFDEPFSVPFEDQVFSDLDPRRQRVLEATGSTLFGAEFAPDALTTYLRPDGISLQALFPWITFREPAAIDDPLFDKVDRSASLPVVAPLFVGLGLVGLVTLVRDRRREAWPGLAIGSVVGLTSTVTIAFIAHRYLADFTPALVVLTAVGAWPVATWLAARRPWPRRLGFAAAGAAVLMGFAVNLALAVQAQRLFFLTEPTARRDFVSFQYELHDRLGGEVPPAVRQTDDLTTLDGRRGDVAIVRGCDGLYWHDGASWLPLELGARQEVELEGDVATAATLASGTGWSIEADRSDDDVRLVFVQDGEPLRAGEAVALEDLDGERLTVAVDEVNGEVSVTAGGVRILHAWAVDAPGPIEAGTGWRASPASPTLCEELRGRL